MQKADDHGRPLHRLNDSVEQHPIEARVLKPNALAVVLDERVHGPFNSGSRGRAPCLKFQYYRGNVASGAASFAWLVSGLPRSLAATWKREGEPTTMPLYMDVHNK